MSSELEPPAVSPTVSPSASSVARRRAWSPSPGAVAWHIWLALSYLGLGAAVLWPVPQHLDDWIVGGGELGGWLWRYWLMKLELEALWVELPGQFSAFFFQMISLGRFPETGNIADLYLVLWPLDTLFGLPAAHNLKWWAILVSNALAGYALARHMTERRWLAWAVGCVAAVNPYVVYELYGTGPRQALLCWVYLSALFLERMLQRPTALNALLGGLSMGLLAAFYWFYALFFGMYGAARVGFALLVKLWRWHRSRSGVQGGPLFPPSLRPMVWGLASWIGMAALALWIAWIFAWPYRVLSTDHTGALPEVQWFAAFPSLEALQNAPPRPATLEENLLSSLARVLKSSWQLDYLWNPLHPGAVPPVVVLCALGLGVLRLRQEGFFVLMALFFWLHTGGPYLQAFGSERVSEYVRWGGTPVTLPYAWTFQYVPMMSRLFAPYRSGAFFWLAVLILLARNLDWLTGWLTALITQTLVRGIDVFRRLSTSLEGPYPFGLGGDRARWRLGISAGVALSVVGLVFFQGLLDRSRAEARGLNGQELLRRGLPVMSSPLKVHPFYEDLAREPGRLGVIELPLHVQQDLVNFYQVVHQKKLLRGWAVPGALPPSLRYLQNSRHPETQKLLWLTGPDTPLRNTFAEALDGLNVPPYNLGVFDPGDIQVLVERGFTYVILHERGCALVWPARGAELYAALSRRLARVLGEGIEHVELIREGDPLFGTREAGYLGDWLRSELAGNAFDATHFRMTVYHLNGASQVEKTSPALPAAVP